MNKITIGSLASTSSDPCSNYTTLDNPWRGTNTTIQLDICDRPFNWTGWYRMLYFGSNIRMPESCVSEYRCGTAITMWMNGLHPQTANGIVSRGICGRQGVTCCAVSYTIRVKACPGNYYVYEFVKPTCTAAYCTDVSTITPRIDPTTATDTAVLLTGGVDPCTDYSVLDEEWRVMYGLLYSIYRGHDDTVAKWSGWYRLYLQGNSAQIPEPDWCASYLTCGGYTPLLLGGAHPLPEDGIVTRDVYGSYGYVIDSKLCNSRRSYPIQVKACPGDYYVSTNSSSQLWGFRGLHATTITPISTTTVASSTQSTTSTKLYMTRLPTVQTVQSFDLVQTMPCLVVLLQDSAINMDSADNATLQQAIAAYPTDSGYPTTGQTSPGGGYTPCSIISSYGWCKGSVTCSHQPWKEPLTGTFCQGFLSVADYTIDFCTLAAESGWNPEAFGAMYQQGLNEDLKDELATRDPPNTLEDLYELAIKLDNRM
ncbi:hypothetical protein NFI96_003209 [Prochilodus magdalenae]|nr:hypothetical protein NFI96_003209 [Prochilodus magdalenae]